MDSLSKQIQAEQPWFETWFDTHHYHRLYGKHDEKEAQGFVDALVTHLRPAFGARVVDVGCGAGRHSRALASHGLRVTGLDLAASSIREARLNSAGSLRFLRHDMRQPLGQQYDYVLNLFTSFGYFDDEAEHQQVIRNLSEAVAPGGTLVIDYLNVVAAGRSRPREAQKIGNVIYRLKRWSNTTHFFKRIAFNAGPNCEHHEYVEQVAKFGLGDFQRMLGRQGMRIEEVFGDYALAPYDPARSPRLIMIAGATRRTEHLHVAA